MITVIAQKRNSMHVYVIECAVLEYHSQGIEMFLTTLLVSELEPVSRSSKLYLTYTTDNC